MAGAVAILAMAGCAGSSSTRAPGTSGTSAALAPRLAGTSLEGHRLSLDAWRGSVVVIVFWASWCAPCQAEQPALNTLAAEEMHSGVHFVGVSLDVDASAARQYVARFAVPYDSLVDPGQTIALDYDVAGPPTTYVIDRDGRVAAHLVGEADPGRLRALVEATRGRG